MKNTEVKEIIGELVLIPVDNIAGHPKNPRKSVGNISELTESVKEQGILQNLTVVRSITVDLPAEDRDKEYVVLIGHRRLAAAKAAGIESVPCRIAILTEEEQVAVMISENMQRSDLTLTEQVDGIQMLMDFGMSVSEVSKSTGLSESTVRRRVQMKGLDREKLQQAVDRQVSIDTLIKINQIESEEFRNRALSYAGTKDFENQFLSIQRKEKEISGSRLVEGDIKACVRLNVFEAGEAKDVSWRWKTGIYDLSKYKKGDLQKIVGAGTDYGVEFKPAENNMSGHVYI